MNDENQENNDTMRVQKEKILSYEDRAEATFQDIGLRVFLVAMLLNIPIALFAETGLLQETSTSMTVSFRSILLSIYGVLINIGLTKAIILHSRNIDEFDGIGAVFRGIGESMFGIVAISIVVSLISSLIVFAITVPLLFSGFANMANVNLISGLMVFLFFIFISLMIVLSTYLNMVTNTASMILIFDNEPIFKTISNARREIKNKKSFAGYFWIQMRFAAIILLATFGIVILAIVNPILFILAIPVAFVVMAVYGTKFVIKMSVYLGDKVLEDYTKTKYPEIDQNRIYKKVG